jgi:hypothetical protein
MSKAIEVLEHAEVVLMKKLRGLRDGKPKWACADELLDVRHAISILKQLDRAVAEAQLSEDVYLQEALTLNPPIAQA